MENSDASGIDPISDRQEILRLWRQQRAYRVGNVLCKVGIPLSLLTTVVDFEFANWPVWGGDLLIAVCCAISLYLSHNADPENPKFVWWPAYFGYWITSFGTFTSTGGINSPFMALVLIVLYLCGVIVQNRVWHLHIFFFALANLVFWLVLENYFPRSWQSAEQPAIFTAAIIALGMSILVTCVNEMLKTEQRLAVEILDRYAELNEARQNLKREEIANASKTTFLANISHELRTPLNSILGFTDLLKDPDTTSEERNEFLDTVQRNGQQLARLVDDLLDLSKIEAGRLEPEMIVCNAPRIFHEVFETMVLSAQKKNLEFQMRSLNPIPVEIISDPVRIKQILLNIIGNAIKFTDSGAVDIQVAYFTPTLEVTVTDTGRGISPEEEGRLFKPFSQADSSMTRKYGGTGLGLNLSRKFAELLGGSLGLLQTERGTGSTFRLRLAAPTADPTSFEDFHHHTSGPRTNSSDRVPVAELQS